MQPKVNQHILLLAGVFMYNYASTSQLELIMNVSLINYLYMINCSIKIITSRYIQYTGALFIIKLLLFQQINKTLLLVPCQGKKISGVYISGITGFFLKQTNSGNYKKTTLKMCVNDWVFHIPPVLTNSLVFFLYTECDLPSKTACIL